MAEERKEEGKMVESGVAWIGKIPEGWHISPLKYNYNMISGGTPDSTKQDFWAGDVNWITPADYKTKDVYVSSGKRNLSKLGYQACSTHMLPAGSLVVSKRAPIGSVAISQNELCTNQGCLGLIKKNKDVDNKYFYYVLSISDDILNLFSSGTTFKEISAAVFSNIVFPCPNIKLQRRIADFLDSKCSEIDALAGNLKERKEGLKEYRRAVITEAVTKGLDDGVKMRESGIPWVGEIPEGWKRTKIKNATSLIRSGTTPSGNRCYESEDINWIQSGDLYGKNIISDTKTKINKISIRLFSSLHVYNPDFIVIAMYGGSVGNIAISKIPACVNQACCCIKPNDGNDLKFMYYWLTICRDDFLRISEGGGQPNISQAKIKNQYYIQPPLQVQHRIADYLDAKCSEIDKLIKNYDDQLTALAEYKKSLIYEYVTGKKEVPEP